MWFAKLFGGRGSHEEDEQPSARPASLTNAGLGTAGLAPSTPARRRAKDTRGKGFDPYNSGAFQRRNAWERVNRR
jgi:hypothetical protein